ncbi:uncharacterized protein LOC118423496 [Branchiostoma floridae]|uniref:Uncharacterized protein LOC118423496 n=1 Tax=Branchiostoma floridae TaxID=7739 RepID=A0A9J7LQN4_BRAFL|nr:uncharacterized protein LOC118423496 [Branchiostoma floridae]
MATPSWEQQFTCTWVNPGRLDMSGFPEDMPTCLQFYLRSIRSQQWMAALKMIQRGQSHSFANESGIVFPKDYESSSNSSSEEKEQSKGPLQEDEVAFFAGFFSKDRVKKSVFLITIRKCLEERRRQCECDPFDGEEQFLTYVSEETFPEPGTMAVAEPSKKGEKETIDALTMLEEKRHSSVAAPILSVKRHWLTSQETTPGSSKRMRGEFNVSTVLRMSEMCA